MSAGLAAAGARIVMAGRTQADLDETAAAIAAEGGEAIGVRADVGNYDDLPRIVATAVDRFGGIDVLVNNAVDGYGASIADLSPELTERVFRVNAHGPLFLAQHAYPYLKASGHGSVINISSVVAFVGTSGHAAYRGSKTALQAYSRIMAKEWAPEVRVNALALGPFETTFGGGWTEARRRTTTAATPLERIAPFHEIVPHVLYLASDASAFVTGTEVIVDGGIVNGKGNPQFVRDRAEMVEGAEARQPGSN